jgi:hypothetical protein
VASLVTLNDLNPNTTSLNHLTRHHHFHGQMESLVHTSSLVKVIAQSLL